MKVNGLSKDDKSKVKEEKKLDKVEDLKKYL